MPALAHRDVWSRGHADDFLIVTPHRLGPNVQTNPLPLGAVTNARTSQGVGDFVEDVFHRRNCPLPTTGIARLVLYGRHPPNFGTVPDDDFRIVAHGAIAPTFVRCFHGIHMFLVHVLVPRVYKFVLFRRLPFQAIGFPGIERGSGNPMPLPFLVALGNPAVLTECQVKANVTLAVYVDAPTVDFGNLADLAEAIRGLVPHLEIINPLAGRLEHDERSFLSKVGATLQGVNQCNSVGLPCQ